MKTRHLLTASLLGFALVVAACGGSTSSGEPVPGDTAGPASGACLVGTADCVDAELNPDGTGGPSTGMCAPGVTDCVDVVVGGGDDLVDHARAVLGMSETELPDDVRVSRRGDEHLMLTEDHVLGRRTVELDDDGSGYRVVSVTVELHDGPRTFVLQPG